jgi:hypothetical protein
MLISRCAWHPFFRGYPRPLGVISWRGRGVSFSDTICPSCAERVRIERLWGIAPPPPVWPGSPQTALIFVGLPLVTILVLLATPLHDSEVPPRPEPTAVLAAEVAVLPRVALAETATAALPHAVVRRQRVAADAIPAVIYETRRPRERARPEPSRTVVRGPRPVVVARSSVPVAPQSP